MDALVSSMSVNWLLVSPRYRLRNAFSVRAKTFQSTCRKSSPGVYARYSANSWLNPKSGERWRPATKPSTTVLATRSRCEIPARSAGSMKRVGVRGCIIVGQVINLPYKSEKFFVHIHFTFVTAFHRRRLPHYYAVGQPVFVTWRLYGSLPANRSFPPVTDSGEAFVAVDRLPHHPSPWPPLSNEPQFAQP